MAKVSTAQHARAPRRRGPVRVTITVSPALADVLDVVAALSGQAPPAAAASLLLANLSEARHDPAVRAALGARRSAQRRLYAVEQDRP